MTTPYCTPTDVKDNTILDLLTQASWSDPNVQTRIDEAQDVIDGRLAMLGFVLPFSTVPRLIRQAAILYVRGAVIRDMSVLSSDTKEGPFGRNGYFIGYNKIMDDLEKGSTALIDGSGNVLLPATPEGDQILSNTDGIGRALTMGDPERAMIDEGYGGSGVTGG